MEELEDFSEKIHEQSNEHAHHMLKEGKEKWVLFVALSTALIAVLAAITGSFIKLVPIQNLYSF